MNENPHLAPGQPPQNNQPQTPPLAANQPQPPQYQAPPQPTTPGTNIHNDLKNDITVNAQYSLIGGKGSSSSNGMATAGFICSLIGLLFLGIPFFGAILSIIGLILSIMGFQKSKEKKDVGKGLAITGIVLGCVALGIVLIILIFFASFLPL